MSNGTAGSITVTNHGAYVARFSVSWSLNNQPDSQSSGNFTAGVSKTITIPAGAVNISVLAEEATGLVWSPWSTIFQKNFPAPVTNCYDVTGTTLDNHYKQVPC